MTVIEDLTIKPVDMTNWSDLETLFESRGGPKYCWCMTWRLTAEELKNNSSDNRRLFMKQRVMDGTPVGLLAYAGDDPVAWCSVAPRDTHHHLGGDEKLDNVWSVTCFFVKREFREKGLVGILIERAKKYAGENGAEYVEAYPVHPDSPSYRFMGFIRTFEKAGFTFVKKAGTRRSVMICKL